MACVVSALVMEFATAETRQPQCLPRPRHMGTTECPEADETARGQAQHRSLRAVAEFRAPARPLPLGHAGRWERPGLLHHHPGDTLLPQVARSVWTPNSGPLSCRGARRAPGLITFGGVTFFVLVFVVFRSLVFRCQVIEVIAFQYLGYATFHEKLAPHYLQGSSGSLPSTKTGTCGPASFSDCLPGLRSWSTLLCSCPASSQSHPSVVVLSSCTGTLLLIIACRAPGVDSQGSCVPGPGEGRVPLP